MQSDIIYASGFLHVRVQLFFSPHMHAYTSVPTSKHNEPIQFGSAIYIDTIFWLRFTASSTNAPSAVANVCRLHTHASEKLTSRHLLAAAYTPNACLISSVAFYQIDNIHRMQFVTFITRHSRFFGVVVMDMHPVAPLCFMVMDQWRWLI
jgi:hypothetical protein